MPNIGPMEIGIVLVIALIVFGPKRVPDLGRSLGKGIREFKGSIGGADDEVDETPQPKVVASTASPTSTTSTADTTGVPSATSTT